MGFAYVLPAVTVIAGVLLPCLALLAIAKVGAEAIDDIGTKKDKEIDERSNDGCANRPSTHHKAVQIKYGIKDGKVLYFNGNDEEQTQLHVRINGRESEKQREV